MKNKILILIALAFFSCNKEELELVGTVHEVYPLSNNGRVNSYYIQDTTQNKTVHVFRPFEVGDNFRYNESDLVALPDCFYRWDGVDLCD